MQEYHVQLGATLRFGAENMLEANAKVAAMLRDGFGPTLGGHNVQIYEPSVPGLNQLIGPSSGGGLMREAKRETP